MPSTTPDAAKRLHWQRGRRLTAGLLAAWIGVGFIAPYFARDLSSHWLLGWPLGFWLAAQGGPLIYLLIVGLYDRRMRRIDADYLRHLASPPAAADAPADKPCDA